MKKFKITVATLALTLMTTPSFAQHETPEQRANAQTEKMAENLALTPEQKAQIAEINLAISQKNAAITADKNMSEETKNESLKGNNDARIQMIKSILNPDQAAKFDDMENPRKQRATTLKKTNINTKLATPTPAQPSAK